MLNIQVIFGNSRDGLYGIKIAELMYKIVSKRKDIKSGFINLKDWQLPYYNEPLHPETIKGNYTDPKANELSKILMESDGFIFIFPEYNHSFPAVLKNMLDYFYTEWNRKPAGFVSYTGGFTGGARGVEHIRSVVIELQMAPIREAIYIPHADNFFDKNGNPKNKNFSQKTNKFLDDLEWWAKALKAGRDN